MYALVIVAVAEVALGHAGDLPPLGVARGLPSRRHAESQLAFVAKWREYHPGAGFDPDFGEWAWRTVLDIQTPGLGPTARRQKIGELVTWFGWEAVLTGNLPPPVPLFWIPDVKRSGGGKR